MTRRNGNAFGKSQSPCTEPSHTPKPYFPSATAGPNSSSHRRHHNDNDSDYESVPSDSTSDSDFVADAEDEAAQDYDDFASDEDVADVPASVVVAPPLPVPPPRRRKAQGQLIDVQTFTWF
jgi:hypothetical protein